MNPNFATAATLAAALLTGCATDVSMQQSLSGMSARYGELATQAESQMQSSGETTAPLYNLCTSYLNMRAFGKASACLDRMEARIRQGDTGILYPNNAGKSDGTPALYVMRAEIALELGQYADAFANAQKGFAKAQHAENSFMGHEQNMHMIAALELMTLSKAFAGDLRAAAAHHQTLADYSFGLRGAGIVAPRRHTALARTNMALGRYEEALEASGRASGFAAIGRVVTLGGFGLLAYYELPMKFLHAKALMESGRTEQAKSEYDGLLGYDQLQDNSALYWMTLYDRGRIAEKEGDGAAAAGYYRKAIDVIERQRATIASEASKIGFVGDKQNVYGRLIAVLIRQGQADEAFDYVERSKSRALVDMLASKQDFAAPDPARARQVLAELAAADAGMPSGNGLSGDAGAGRRNVQVVRQAVQSTAPELSTLVTVSSVPAPELKALIGRDETLVEYYYQGDDLYVFVVDRERVQAFRLALGDLPAQVQALRRALEDPASPAWQEGARKLYARLWQPLEGRVTSANVVVVAHGVLHYLPFAMLQDGAGRHLVDRHGLRFLPSASVLKYLRPALPRQSARLLALGNPDLDDSSLDLAFAEGEARLVASLYPNSRLMLRKDASESNFKKAGAAFARVHFASHGKFQADEPLKSGLYLAKDADNDGVLTVGELYSMTLDTDLVTLSACETGLGRIASGDDVVGLTRGFLYAGSRAIVASLWSVDDKATAGLMQAFYNNLATMNKREALRQAQIKARAAFPHPFYWAAFQLTGRAE